MKKETQNPVLTAEHRDEGLREVRIYSRYNPPPKLPTDYFETEESRTQQQFKDECDVNNILAKYKQTGMLNHVVKTQGDFGDFSNVDDYQETLHKLRRAQESFEALPSDLRSKFHNDPGELINFIADEKNREDSIKYGLIIPKKEEVPLKVQVLEALQENDKIRSSKKIPTPQS